MGKAGDADAAVASKDRVYNVTGLRLANVSIFLVLAPGHPQSTWYGVGGKINAHVRSGS